MASQIDVFLLMFFLILSLGLLWCYGWLTLQPSHFKTEAVRTTVRRLLKPRTPDDCPLCRLATAPSMRTGPDPGPVRPWSEVKSRRGAPKRVNTQGFACPNPQCAYFGITDPHIQALVGDGKHAQTLHERSFRTLHIPHLQLDELRTRLRKATQIRLSVVGH